LTKILIIRFSSIGDIVLTTPLLRCLKKQVPGAELHYLTKKQYRTILDENPNIDKIYTIEHGLREVMPMLRKEKYDYLLDLHRNLRSTGVLLGLWRPFSRLHKLDFKKWLLVRFKINVLPKIHVVDRYVRVAKRFGIVNDGQGLDYFTRPEEVSLPATHRGGFVAFVIGGRHNTKMFPEEKVMEVCSQLGEAVILLGGPKDSEKGEHIAAACGEMVVNACGRYSLSHSALLIRQAKLVITNDTGLMHIAAAFRKKIVSTWGNTVTSFGMYPYLPEADREKSVIVEVKGLKCRPCSKLGFTECPKKHFDCMNKMEASTVVLAARKLLAFPV
jgi:heptosyltransferase-2